MKQHITEQQFLSLTKEKQKKLFEIVMTKIWKVKIEVIDLEYLRKEYIIVYKEKGCSARTFQLLSFIEIINIGKMIEILGGKFHGIDPLFEGGYEVFVKIRFNAVKTFTKLELCDALFEATKEGL